MLVISATSSVTTNLLLSSLHFILIHFCYFSYCGLDDYSVVFFLLSLFRFSPYNISHFLRLSKHRLCHSSTVSVNRGRILNILVSHSASGVVTNKLSSSTSNACSLIIIYI